MSVFGILGFISPLVFDLKFWVGVVVGGVLCVTIPAVYNWFKKQTASAESKVTSVNIAAAEKAVSNAVSSIEKKI